MTKDELETAKQWCRIYGSANCWAGTFGGIAATLWRLIEYYERQEAKQCK